MSNNHLYVSWLPQFRYIKPFFWGMYQVGCSHCDNEWLTDSPTTREDLKKEKCDQCKYA